MQKKRINLLPPEEQKHNTLLDINYQIVRLGLMITATILVLGAGLFVSSLFFENTLDRTESEIASYGLVLARFQKAGLEQEITELNESMANFNSLSRAPTVWSPYLAELARILPAPVSIDTLKIDAQTRQVESSGQAATRDSVLELRRNILKSPYFENINFPLANLQTPVDVPWKFRFYVKPNVP